MSEKQIIYYKNRLIEISNDIKGLENNPSNNLLPEKKQLDLLEKKFEYKEILIEIAILEKKEESYIENLKEERNILLKKVIEFRKAKGFSNNDLEQFIEKQKGVRTRI